MNEVQRWFEEGRTYEWMVKKYREKYNIETTYGMWANIRRRHGWEPRSVVDRDLIPWRIRPEHQADYAVQMLRLLARRRAGRENSEGAEARLESWLKDVEDKELVVYYDPIVGFVFVPREEKDTDIVRMPPASQRR